MTYFLDAANLSTVNAESGFLRYYSPIAVTCQRAFITPVGARPPGVGG